MLYPIQIYIACGAVHYQHQNPLDNQKSTSTINAYININMTKKARMKQNKSSHKVNCLYNSDRIRCKATKGVQQTIQALLLVYNGPSLIRSQVGSV